MKYPSGEEVRLGDRVKLWEGCLGVVVASLDQNEYAASYPRAEWEYLKSGVLIESDKAGLIHYLEPEKTLELVERASGRAR